MTVVAHRPEALDDVERLVDVQPDSVAGRHVLELILSAVEMLERHPLVGRPIEDGLRELVISRGRTGYVALYHHEPIADRALVLAVRHQREAGWADAAESKE